MDIRKITSHDEYAEQFRLKAEEWARFNGEADRLEHMRKIVLGELVNQIGGPIGKAEHEAHAHGKYQLHIGYMTEARTRANIAKAQMEAMRMRFEGWRTKNATRRAEMKVL
ncbi:MAG: hypothetical protein ACR2RF_24860 [Geminicoccaceae bacterium]